MVIGRILFDHASGFTLTDLSYGVSKNLSSLFQLNSFVKPISTTQLSNKKPKKSVSSFRIYNTQTQTHRHVKHVTLLFLHHGLKIYVSQLTDITL